MNNRPKLGVIQSHPIQYFSPLYRELAKDPANPAEMRAAVLKALSLPKGQPEGLDFFSFPNFQTKCHQILARILKTEGLVWAPR